MFNWERGVHLVESEDHLGIRIIYGSFWYFMNVEITTLGIVELPWRGKRYLVWLIGLFRHRMETGVRNVVSSVRSLLPMCWLVVVV